MAAERALMTEFKALSKEPWTNIELINENIHEWSVALIPLASDSVYFGGYYKAKITFPKDYPYSPPDFKFIRPLYHPNVYPDGRLCISILHAPGEDIMSGETAGERWSAAQRVESVLISILSLLDDAELSSPANVDAGVMLRKDPDQYKERVAEDVKKSKEDIPEGFVMPTSETAFQKRDNLDDDFNMSWEDSDEESFGGSESEDFEMDDDDEEASGSDAEEEEDE